MEENTELIKRTYTELDRAYLCDLITEEQYNELRVKAKENALQTLTELLSLCTQY